MGTACPLGEKDSVRQSCLLSHESWFGLARRWQTFCNLSSLRIFIRLEEQVNDSRGPAAEHACRWRFRSGHLQTAHTGAMLTPEDQQATMARLLPFQQQMVEELLADDGLCIMSAGMGWQTVINAPDGPSSITCCAAPASEQVPAMHAIHTKDRMCSVWSSSARHGTFETPTRWQKRCATAACCARAPAAMPS